MADIEVTSRDQLWEWLSTHFAQRNSVRLITWKAAHPQKYVSRDEVLDALIAHGWIDGRRFTIDEDRTAQLISPRKQQAWSKSYKGRAERLRQEGLMHPAGEASIKSSKASGLWNFFDDVDALIVPDDLSGELDLNKWEQLPPSYRRNVLRWIKIAKNPTTRQRRINKTVETTHAGKRMQQM
ncbi:YdeI family protein [Ruegeria sp. 6PALISEP08]|uniref:YdeI/OmpD-associated family protein n=1 Tax=Ruegeria sp. 6PALISEP08 TaxID=1225660 RepID=UPI00067E6C2C|nr:YdeI/OmpD-associated family protein [Ruegeria sp. 6PALISEP08]